MMKYGIAVVHKTLAPEAGWLFCLDAPRHREPLDLTRKMTVCGWASHGQSRNAAAVVCRRDDRVSKIGMDQVRSDVAKHVLKTTGRVISDRCGFRFQVPAFEELELFIEEASGALVPLVAISVVAMDALSDSAHDAAFLHPDVPLSQRLSHGNFWNYVTEIGNKAGLRVLEVGSRAVTDGGKGPRGKELFAAAEYVGFDYYPGKNVDVVGDAHALSRYFDKPFDLVVSFAVFEHFAMPWIVAREIARCLKVGGVAAIETHFSFSSHERPWHFFQCSDMALKALFSPALGFECIEAGFSNPIVGRFSSLADAYLRNRPVTGLYCHSELLARKVRHVEDFSWDSVSLDAVVGELVYPAPRPAPEDDSPSP